MAQKQYSFDFVLNAVLNGGFSGTFTKAQQEFVRLGTEIKNLQAIQRDVKAYEKQTAAVQNTSQKLENLKRQYKLVSQQISETTGSTTALEREKLKLEQRIANASAALEKQNNTLSATKERLETAGVSTDNLAGKDEELEKKIEELTEEQKKAAESAENFGGKGVAAVEAVGSAIAAAGITEAMKEIAGAYMECVGVAGDFEQAMSAVEAIAEANSSEMKALTAEAKDLGATTKFTAQQSANAMEYMAMAGWDAQEMLNGMNGVINLAAAAGEDLAQVSDIVTDNLSAFGLVASDTAHFADVLAAAAANSNTNISIMGETFKSSSAVAGALGYSIEDVAVMVGLMANNAVKGSRAGTALRNIFNGLLGGVTLTSAAFGEMEYSVINSDGSMKGLMETVEDLRGYFNQMTEAERANNAMTIAGMRGYNGLLAILNATDEDFQSLYASVNNCTGAAERMASVKLDNLNGDITIMNSAMEALQNTIGEQFNPELRELTQLGTEAIQWINTFIQENESLSKGMTATIGTAAGLTGAIVGINSAIKAFRALKALGVFTGLTGGMFLAAGAAAALVGTVVAVTDATRDGGPAVRELTEAARAMDEAIVDAGDTCEETTASTLAAADVANTYIDKLEAMGDMANASDEKQKQYQNTLALLLQVMPELSDCISTTTDEYGRATYTLETTTAALRANTEEWKRNAKAQAYQEYLNALMEQYNGVMLEAAENEIGLTQAQYQLEAANQSYSAAVARMNELWQEASEEADRQYRENGILADATKYLSQEYYDLQDSLVDLSQAAWDAQGSVEAHEKAIEKDAEAVAAAEAEMDSAKQTVEELTEAMGDYADGQADTVEQEAAVREALDETMASVQELTEAYAAAYDEALESFSGQFGLFDEAKADAEATVEAAQKALDTQLTFWQEYAANIATLKEQSAESLNTTEENYNAMMEYVRSGAPEAAGLAASMVKAINDGNTQALTNIADTLGKISESQVEAAGDVAEWTTDLNEQMDQFIQDMEENIAALDMSAEAAESGRATVQSYVDAADGMLPQVQAAFRRIASAAVFSMGYLPYSESAYIANGNAYRYGGFASGTDNAPPGWSWVGEEGPELMRMHGGEQVLPSHVSQEVAQIYQVYNKYSGEYAAANAQGIQNSTCVVAPSNWDGSYFSIPGHAEGTDNAPPGWSWVGEEGPELMRMHGGEQILPSHVSQEVAQIYQVYNKYSGEYAAANAQGIQNSTCVVAPSNWDGSYFSIPGHAEGTDNAPPGWSWVGEEGPELMRMYGGEQILPSHVSQEVARTYRAYNKYSGEYAAARAVQGVRSSTCPALEIVGGGRTSDGSKVEMHFHIEAGASPETVNAWQNYANSGELRATILEVMEDAQADTRRRTLA